MSKDKTSELRLLAPRRARLTRTQEREAVVLLAELLLAAAAKRRGFRSAGALNSVSGGAFARVVPFPGDRGNRREAA